LRRLAGLVQLAVTKVELITFAGADQEPEPHRAALVPRPDEAASPISKVRNRLPCSNASTEEILAPIVLPCTAPRRTVDPRVKRGVGRNHVLADGDLVEILGATMGR
jgi:hypothetical protein